MGAAILEVRCPYKKAGLSGEGKRANVQAERQIPGKCSGRKKILGAEKGLQKHSLGIVIKSSKEVKHSDCKKPSLPLGRGMVTAQ